MSNEHIVYTEVLNELGLKKSHEEQLKERGFKDNEIALRGYKTFPKDGLKPAQINRIIKAVEAQQATVNGVAGFYYDVGTKNICASVPMLLTKKSDKESTAESNARNATVLPILDFDGFIRALKFRLDTKDPKRKYSYFSSAKMPQGNGVKPFIHWPKTNIVRSELRVVRITEGEFKAEILSKETQYYTISIAGVTQWREAINEIRNMPELEQVILCPDSDKDAVVDPYTGRRAATNNVAKSFAAFAYELKCLGYNVSMETWDASYGKGADDVIINHGFSQIRRMSDDEMDQFVQKHGRPAFPHVQYLKSGASRVLGTKENVEALCEFLGIKFIYNEVKRKEEILTNNPEFRYGSFDNIVNEVKSRAVQYSLPNNNIAEFIDLIAAKNTYNPAKLWIESKKWDGTSRFKMFCRTLRVADGWEETRDLYLEKWMIGGVAALYEPDYWTKLCLVLAGNGSIGKTTWFNNLFGEISSEVFQDGLLLDPSNKDSVFEIVTNWCVELGELSATFRKRDREELKAFITKRKDHLRLPYGRKPVNYKRQCFFGASVDEAFFLSDHAGDVRFGVLPVISIDWQGENEIDMQQVFAEVKECYYDRKCTWWMDSEQTRDLINNNRKFREVDPIEEILDMAYGLDSIVGEDIENVKTSSQIAEELVFHDYVTSREANGTFIRKLSKVIARFYPQKQYAASSKRAKGFYMPPIKNKDDYQEANNDVALAESLLQ